MKCPKCQSNMQTDIENHRYICENESCKNIVEWVINGEKEKE